VELVDQLLAILAGPNPGFASQQLRAAGHGEDEISGAWNFARAAAFTESSRARSGSAYPSGSGAGGND
jgi:hypothetical protein